MTQSTGSDSVPVAILDGGPLDGREQDIDGEKTELCAVMSDGHQHRYLRTEVTRVLADGRTALEFRWAGRSYGPK